MIMLSQVIPFSITDIIPIVINILFNTLTIWLSAQAVTSKAEIQNALLFSAITYFVLIFLRFIPIPSLPFVTIAIIIEVAIKSLLAMKLFDADFREGISIVGVQMIFGLVISLPF